MENKTISRYRQFVVVSLVLGVIAFMFFISPFLLKTDLLRNALKEYRSLINGDLFKILLVMFALLGCGFAFYVLGRNITEDRDNKLKKFATFSFAFNIFLIVMTICLSLLEPRVFTQYSVISSSLLP